MKHSDSTIRQKLARSLRLMCLAGLLIPVSCTTHPDTYPTVAAVDIDRFMGDWYVQGHTPVFFDKDSSDQMESYQLDAKGGIDTHYSFKKNGTWHRFNPYGRIYNQATKAHWKMQFLWPFTSDYLIVRLDQDYSQTVISVPDKSLIWIMSRQRQLPENLYQSLVDDLSRDGYPVSKIRRVSQGSEPIPH